MEAGSPPIGRVTSSRPVPAGTRTNTGTVAACVVPDFQYSGVEQRMAFTGKPGKYFWSNGYAWGTCEVSEDDVTLELLKGKLRLKQLEIGDKVLRLKDASWTPGDKKTFRL